ncbi:MAG: MmgE/PrpD family protein [Burkholderiales bacterium]
MAHDISQFLISEARAIDIARLPADVIDVASQSVLDWFGVTIAGACEPLVLKLLDEARYQGGHPLCTLVGHNERTSPAFAALINGAAADAADFSDVHLALHGHPTAAVVAAALAVAEARGANGAQFLAAVIAGIELECRIGLLIQPESYQQTGFHPTGPVVHFGATAAAAHLMGLNETQWEHALGIAATQAAGLKASAGSMCKPTHCGFAAMHGVMGASLASRGFTSGKHAIDGPVGFAVAHSPAQHHEQVLSSTGRFLILDTQVKRHAACALTHGTIENMLKLRRDGVTADRVKKIEIEVTSGHLNVVGHRQPETDLQAKFSLWATAALALLGEDTGNVETFSAENIQRPELRALMSRIEVRERPDLDFSVAIASVELANGHRVFATTDTSEPERDLELRRRQVIAKFNSLVTPALRPGDASELQNCVFDMQRAASLASILRLSEISH